MAIYYKGQRMDGGNTSGVGESAGEVYSTEETKIGTWIDGKPLYRRVLNVNLPSTAGSPIKITGSEIPNIKLLVRLAGTVPISVPTTHMYIPNADDIFYVDTTGQCLLAYMKNAGLTGSSAVLTVEYTKTTD